jgi:hypothetical protein
MSLQYLWRFCYQQKHQWLLDKKKKAIASETGKQKLPDILHLVSPTTALVPNTAAR